MEHIRGTKGNYLTNRQMKDTMVLRLTDAAYPV